MVARRFDEMHDPFREALEQPIEFVRQHPMAAMFVAFGAGLGIGVLISQTLADEDREPLLSGRTKQQICDTLANVLPAMLQRQFREFAS